MTAFWTLLKREYLDHKGGMFWTPLIITTLFSLLIAYSVIKIPTVADKMPVTHFSIESKRDGTFTKPDGTIVERKTTENADGEEITTITVKDKTGKQTAKVTVNTDDEGDEVASGLQIVNFNGMKGLAEGLRKQPEAARQNGARSIGVLFSGITLPILITMAIVIPFLLLGSLFDERQDRSILFWKSLPVSDTRTVLSKLVANAGGSLVIALGCGMILHILALAGATLIGSRYDLPNIGSLWHLPTIVNAWFTWFNIILHYTLWVLPVYAWLLFVSATSPRAPFLMAFLIPGALAVIEKIMLPTQIVTNQFFGRLIAAPLWEPIGRMTSAKPTELGDPGIFLAQARHMLWADFTQPDLWIGLAIAAALLYATIEMRRRKAL